MEIVSTSGKTILIDPWFSGNPSATQDADQVKACDLLLLTHAHSDHVTDATSIARRLDPPVVTIFDFTQILAKEGITNLHGINKGGTVEIDGIKITGTHALHSSSYQMPNGEQVYAGDALGFVIQLENGLTIYDSGDTALFSDMALIGKSYHPSIAIVPIGDHFTMGPREAAEAAKLIGAKKVFPVHWGTFPILTGTAAEFAKYLEGTGIEMIRLKPGETYTEE